MTYNQCLNILYYSIHIKLQADDILRSNWTYQEELFLRYFNMQVTEPLVNVEGMMHNTFVKKYCKDWKFTGVPDYGVNIVIFNCMIADFHQDSLFQLLHLVEDIFQKVININIGDIDDRTPEHKHVHANIKAECRKYAKMEQFEQYFKLKQI